MHHGIVKFPEHFINCSIKVKVLSCYNEEVIVYGGANLNYQALYRMYRPQSFEDVVGQEHVTKTLRNAISKKNSRMLIFLVVREVRENEYCQSVC